MRGEGGMFSYTVADNIDKLLMLFGTLGSIGDGMIIPGVMFLLSGPIDTYGNLEPRSSDISSANRTVDKPLIIGCFYAKNTVMMNFFEKARKAQNKGSQLASEALLSHRTITAFSLQERMLSLFAVTVEGPRKEMITQSWFSVVSSILHNDEYRQDHCRCRKHDFRFSKRKHPPEHCIWQRRCHRI